MKVERIEKPTPIIVIDDFLSVEDATLVLEECIKLEPIYRPAEVLDSKNGSVINSSFRKNEVVYLDTVFTKNEARSKILSLVLRKGVYGPQMKLVWAEGNTGFELINQTTRAESVLSRYGDSDFYGFHRDYNFHKANRIITAVYYCNMEPAQYSGGELSFRANDTAETPRLVIPKHNRLVVFNSGAYHSVLPTKLESKEFKDGRFSVNMWLGFQN